MTEEKRPKLTDPKEWAIIRNIYFGGMNKPKDDMDPLERLDRMEKKKTKNQAR